MSDLYNTDIVLWSEEQATLLRRLAAARPNDPSLDWEHIIEEIEDVGGSAIRAVRSLIIQTLLHEVKCAAWPDSVHVEHWRGEARAFQVQAAAEFLPSMRQRIDLGDLYRRARRALPETVDGRPPLPVMQTCPLTLDALLADDYAHISGSDDAE